MSIKTDPFSFLDNQIERAFAEIQEDRAAGYIVPKRRVCGFSGIEKPHQKETAASMQFVLKKEMIGAPRAMKFLPSPFPDDTEPFTDKDIRRLKKVLGEAAFNKMMLDDALATKKKVEAVAITKEGRHVILQQAVASCVPTSVAMLVLDHGGIPNYDSIQNTHFATADDAIRWFENAGFTTKSTKISSKNKIETLIARLKEHGPGILKVNDKDSIGSHRIVLDAISTEQGTATIRDPFHGWQIDMELDAFQKICGNNFIQITGIVV